MTRTRFQVALLLALGISSSAVSVKAETIYVAGNPKGKDVVINLEASMAGKTIGVYVGAPTSTTQAVEVGVKGLGGEVVKVEGITMLGKQKAQNAALSQTNPLTMTSGGKVVKLVTILKPGQTTGGQSSSTGSVTNVSDTPDPNCGCLTKTEIDNALGQYASYYPGGLDALETQLCSHYPKHPEGCSATTGVVTQPTNDNNSSSTNSGEYTSGTAMLATTFLSYNRCLPAATPGILVKIDLSGVDSGALAGKTLTVATLFSKFTGGVQASVKPKSDGRYSPQPLLLTASLNGYYFNGSDTVKMNRWRSKKLASSTTLDVVATINYGANLLEIPMGRMLSGGQGTFEVTNPTEGYSYCASFTKTRQRWGGYGHF